MKLAVILSLSLIITIGAIAQNADELYFVLPHNNANTSNNSYDSNTSDYRCDDELLKINERFRTSLLSIQSDYERAIEYWRSTCCGTSNCDYTYCQQLYRELEILYQKTIEAIKQYYSSFNETYFRQHCTGRLTSIQTEYERQYIEIEQEYTSTLLYLQEEYMRKFREATERYKTRIRQLQERYKNRYVNATIDCTKEGYSRIQQQFTSELVRIEEEFHLKLQEIISKCCCGKYNIEMPSSVLPTPIPQNRPLDNYPFVEHEENYQQSGTKVRVLNVSADKNAEEANGFARKVANLVKKIDSDIVIVDVANGVDSGIPQVYYNGKKNKELASEIAQYLDGAVEDGTLGVDIPYMFSPAAPLPGGYAKDVDIVIEAPANFEAAEEEETTETAPSDENTQ